MCWNYNWFFGRDISSDFFGTLFYYKASETAQVDVIAVSERLSYGVHKCFNSGLYGHFFYSGLISNLRYYICFCHIN